MTGAADDLSSLFGEELRRDPGMTAMRPVRADPRPAGDLASQVGDLANKITGLEYGLTDAVERIQAVDRHLATTFQGLQAIFDRMPADPGTPEVAGALQSLDERLTTLVDRSAASLEREPSRLARVEITMRSALERLTVLEDLIETLLSEARSGLQTLDEVNERLGGGARPAPRRSAPAARGKPDEAASSDEEPDDPEPEPEPEPAGPPVEYWSSTRGGGTESTR